LVDADTVKDAKPSRNTPFVVGVSGHRDLDLDGAPRLKDAVAAFVQELQRRLPNTELHIAVGMAEGADLVVAQVALELGVYVEAILPMTLTEYEANFEPEGRALLHDLLAHANCRIAELAARTPSASGSGATGTAPVEAPYSVLTDTLIRRSSLLLAVWDGQPSDLPGGTADTVLRYSGVRTEEHGDGDAIAFVDAGAEFEFADHLVYWIPTGRRSRPLAGAARPPCFLLGVGDNMLQVQQSMPSQLQAQLAELDNYNRDFDQMAADGRIAPPDSLIDALPADVAGRVRPYLTDVDAQYGKADSLAIYYQRHSDRLFGLFGVMTFTMGLAYLIYEKLTESRIVLLTYLVVLLSSLGLYYFLQGRRWFAKHLTYRALAETMRAKFYLRLAGVDHRVDAGEVLTLSGIDRFRGFGWLSYVLKAIEPFNAGVPIYPAVDSPHPDRVEQAWIESQYQYFSRKVAKLSTSSRRVKLLRNTLFLVILLVIIALFLFGDRMHEQDARLGVSIHNLLTFCMGFLAVLLGVWELHQDKMATHELLWQYRNQLRHFSHARVQLERTSSKSRRDELLVELGKDSLMESFIWTIHRYHREHEPPAAH
jgi:hypothetical protein